MKSNAGERGKRVFRSLRVLCVCLIVIAIARRRLLFLCVFAVVVVVIVAAAASMVVSFVSSSFRSLVGASAPARISTIGNVKVNVA